MLYEAFRRNEADHRVEGGQMERARPRSREFSTANLAPHNESATKHLIPPLFRLAFWPPLVRRRLRKVNAYVSESPFHQKWPKGESEKRRSEVKRQTWKVKSDKSATTADLDPTFRILISW